MDQSTANNQNTFIERVRLQGYKSIEDVEVTFKPGLNILIGANGSGKTNFVRFLDLLLERKFDKISIIFQAEIDYHANEKEYIYSLKYKNLHSGKFHLIEEEHVVTDGGNEINKNSKEWHEWYLEWKTTLTPNLISYGISTNFQNINEIEKIEVKNIGELSSSYPRDLLGNNLITWLSIEPPLVGGLYELFYKVLIPLLNLPNDKKNKLSFPAEFLDNLSLYSPVKDIRLEESLRVETIKNGKEILHVRFEFFVDGKWRPWTHLSDGTKRLVYIITEVTFANNIILLEEPELGIHPHQLSKLMDFLEAAAEHKQIILTTHSPQVLNSLRTDELDRIIVVRYEKDKGTKMSHLTEIEQEEARIYMEASGLDLSDYWVHSSLEKETESV